VYQFVYLFFLQTEAIRADGRMTTGSAFRHWGAFSLKTNVSGTTTAIECVMLDGNDGMPVLHGSLRFVGDPNLMFLTFFTHYFPMLFQ